MWLSECRSSIVCVRECSFLNVGAQLFVLGVQLSECTRSIVYVRECSCLNVGAQLFVRECSCLNVEELNCLC